MNPFFWNVKMSVARGFMRLGWSFAKRTRLAEAKPTFAIVSEREIIIYEVVENSLV
tara:strand:- start:200 stop:367 length:168 start_codon:yes stop_codon:yes gene_type:complete